MHLIACQSNYVRNICKKYGWFTGARYTNICDIRQFNDIGMIDIDWKNYDYDKHIWAFEKTRPRITIARDVEDVDELDAIINQSERLSAYASRVCIVPKDLRLMGVMETVIPAKFLYGYSVPTKYGGTQIPTS